jgi:phage tail tape-measure protein
MVNAFPQNLRTTLIDAAVLIVATISGGVVTTNIFKSGLSNVDNTSDINKPVSTAQAAADALVASNAATATALKADAVATTAALAGKQATLTVGQFPGSTTNAVAIAGNIGEVISSNVVVGSAVALSNGVAVNITSVSLTAGHWQVSGSICVEGATSTSITNIFAGITPTTGTLPTTANGGAYLGLRTPAFIISSGQAATCYPIGAADIYLSGTTTYFLVAQVSFTASTLGGYGFLRAIRVQ